MRMFPRCHPNTSCACSAQRRSRSLLAISKRDHPAAQQFAHRLEASRGRIRRCRCHRNTDTARSGSVSSSRARLRLLPSSANRLDAYSHCLCPLGAQIPLCRGGHGAQSPCPRRVPALLVTVTSGLPTPEGPRYRSRWWGRTPSACPQSPNIARSRRSPAR